MSTPNNSGWAPIEQTPDVHTDQQAASLDGQHGQWVILPGTISISECAGDLFPRLGATGTMFMRGWWSNSMTPWIVRRS
jgi:hypothetical protein